MPPLPLLFSDIFYLSPQSLLDVLRGATGRVRVHPFSAVIMRWTLAPRARIKSLPCS